MGGALCSLDGVTGQGHSDTRYRRESQPPTKTHKDKYKDKDNDKNKDTHRQRQTFDPNRKDKILHTYKVSRTPQWSQPLTKTNYTKTMKNHAKTKTNHTRKNINVPQHLKMFKHTTSKGTPPTKTRRDKT